MISGRDFLRMARCLRKSDVYVADAQQLDDLERSSSCAGQCSVSCTVTILHCVGSRKLPANVYLGGEPKWNESLDELELPTGPVTF